MGERAPQILVAVLARLDLFGPEIAVTDPLHAITLTSTDFFL
jgi:hypothetical protein